VAWVDSAHSGDLFNGRTLTTDVQLVAPHHRQPGLKPFFG
jgi:hypothetical protein